VSAETEPRIAVAYDRAASEPDSAGGDYDGALAAVRDTTLDLLRALPERPERLRVRAGGASVDLDWRAGAATAVVAAPQPVAPSVASVASVAAGVAPAAASDGGGGSPVAAPAGGPDTATHYVCATSVGTFYRAPEPGADPFVVEGSTVGKGQQVGIIEAMKLMLPVEADRSGRVAQVLVEDGQPVEYGDRLFALDVG
jgi:acetyl-CoA carboxylase biotin carboxyl carrier protein